MVKKTVPIRIKVEDRDIWKEYCKMLGEPSERLFSKILESKEVKLRERILNEFKKKEESFKFKNNKYE